MDDALANPTEVQQVTERRTEHRQFNGSFQQPDAGIFGPATRGERPPVLIADLGQGTVTNPVPPIYVTLKETMDFPSSTPSIFRDRFRGYPPCSSMTVKST